MPVLRTVRTRTGGNEPAGTASRITETVLSANKTATSLVPLTNRARVVGITVVSLGVTITPDRPGADIVDGAKNLKSSVMEVLLHGARNRRSEWGTKPAP